MKRLIVITCTVILLFVAGAALRSFGAVTAMCNATCLQKNCNGQVQGNADGRPTGCTQAVGGACAGTCNICNGSTTKQICIWGDTTNPPCYSDTGLGTLNCGFKVPRVCGGTWAANCTCPLPNGTPTMTACVFSRCT
jgi:hypothetical protein